MRTSAFAIVGLVALVTGLILLLVLRGMGYVALSIIGLGIVMLGGSAIFEFRRVRGALTSRRGKMGTSTTILVSVFVGIILLTNSISIWKYHRFDFTGLSQFTVTSQTKDVLKNLDQPVEVICFFVPSDQYGAGAYAAVLLKEYEQYTDKLIITRIDPEAHPEQARKYGISYYQTVVFSTKLGTRLVTPDLILTDAEHSFTSAILEVTGQKQLKVYFLTGHGEANPLDTSTSGYSQARSALMDNLFQVATLDLVATPRIPDDAAALVIAGPSSSMTDGERKIIADYLAADGHVLFMTNPGAPDDVARLLAPWGLDPMGGTIIDPSSYSTPDKDSPLVPRTRDYLQLNNVYFPGVTWLEPRTDAPREVQLIPLAWTSADAWMTPSYDPTKEARFNEATDKKGDPSMSMAVLITAAQIPAQTDPSTGQPRTDQPTEYYEAPEIIVIGDSDFASNKAFNNGDNGTFFLRMVQYLSQGKSIISIDQKVLQTRRLIVTPEESRFLTYSSIAFLPLLVLAIGAFVWWRRR